MTRKIIMVELLIQLTTIQLNIKQVNISLKRTQTLLNKHKYKCDDASDNTKVIMIPSGYMK